MRARGGRNLRVLARTGASVGGVTPWLRVHQSASRRVERIQAETYVGEPAAAWAGSGGAVNDHLLRPPGTRTRDPALTSRPGDSQPLALVFAPPGYPKAPRVCLFLALISSMPTIWDGHRFKVCEPFWAGGNGVRDDLLHHTSIQNGREDYRLVYRRQRPVVD